MKMNAQETKLQAAENDLKQLMANVIRAMEKAQEAVGRIASKLAIVAIAETESSRMTTAASGVTVAKSDNDSLSLTVNLIWIVDHAIPC